MKISILLDKNNLPNGSIFFPADSLVVDRVIDVLKHKLDLHIEVKHIFNQGTLLQKRELVKMLFDSNLYYRAGLFFTTSINKIIKV